MDIGVISDTHLDEPTNELEKLCDTVFSKVDLILHAGDITNHLVLDVFYPIPVIAVAGNMDPLSTRSQLKEKEIIVREGFYIGLTHGWGAPLGLEQRVRGVFGPEVDCIVYGHSHIPANHVEDGLLFFNPGTFGRGLISMGRRTVGVLHLGDEITGEIIRL
ncbi:MAG: YfcE family phosphodiesterase [Deltaproteobacteria bacterium]|nr:YfcE family phosphodiesterase [Deltaproteobacteria bacterium]